MKIDLSPASLVYRLDFIFSRKAELRNQYINLEFVLVLNKIKNNENNSHAQQQRHSLNRARAGQKSKQSRYLTNIISLLNF